ncbi:MAG: energy-coupling factor ABC transporter ATP-binding protein [Candidatus Asgardarchaeia archaeon]
MEIRGLSFKYEGSDEFAIKEINLNVPKGQFLVLTGPSGCGKTTLIRCINGLIPSFYWGEYRGEVNVLGKNPRKVPPRILSTRIGTVFQFPEDQIVGYRVWRDVAFGPENLALEKDEVLKRVRESLSIVGMVDLMDVAVHELSGGEKQRLAIADVLAMRPEIFILDEPTSETDPRTSRVVLKTLERIRDELDCTVIVTEHKLDVVSEFADRIVVMCDGKIMKDGPPEDVLFDDSVLSVGIGIPKSVMVYKRLEEMGLSFESKPLDFEGMVKVLKGKFIELRGHQVE